MENTLLNPITVKRIELVCGSIEAFLADPSKLSQSKLDPNFAWMRTVSPQEAQACRERLHLWAKSDKAPSGGSLGEWLFKPIAVQNHVTQTPPEAPALVIAKTLGAAQRKWRVPSEFPCCPQELAEKPIMAYAEKLKAGVIFSRNDFSESAVLETAVAEDNLSVWVMCEQRKEGAVKPWSLAHVTFEDGLYVHTSLGTFFSKEGAEKQFCLAQGFDWTGGDSIDDYC